MRFLIYIALAPLLLGIVGCGASSATQVLMCSNGVTSTARGIRNGDPAPSCASNSIAFIDSTISTGDYLCSGVLIRPNVVLTAGHCVAGGNHSMKVAVGKHPTITSTVQALHPQYQTNGYPTAGIDVGLVFLSQSLNDVVPLPLTQTIPPIGSSVTAFGFGLNGVGQDGNGNLGMLLEGALQLVSYANGSSAMPAALVAHANTPKSQETCEGDSGGPLLYQGQVVGILSGGNAKGNRCVDSTDSSFTTIAVALPWIVSKIGNQ